MKFVAEMANLLGDKLSQTKAEAFLRGYLAGLGAARSYDDNPPMFDLIAEDPEIFITIERNRLEIRKKVTEQQIEEATDALREIYTATGREVPEWMKKGHD